MTDDNTLTTEYASVEALKRLTSELNALTDKVNSLDNRVQTTIDNRLLEMEERMIDRIERSQVDTESRIKKERDDRLDTESKLSKRIDEIHQNTNQALSAITSKIATVSETVNRVDGTIVSWHVAVEATNESFKQAQRRLDETEERLDEIGNRQQLLEATQRQTHKTIHGDASEDGPDSLFKAISNLGDKFTREFTSSQSAVNTVLNLARNNSNAIEKIERERLEEKQRWTKRAEVAQKYLEKAVTTPWFWVTLIIAIVGLFVTINPATQEFFTNLIGQSFSYLFRP